MKTISKDGTYIDYTGPNYGVRVWEDVCRPIALEGNAWIEYDESSSLPLAPREIELPIGRIDSISALAKNLCDYEVYRPNELHENKTELRELLVGSITFDSAKGSS